ncbi:MAG: NUDIX hydrolase [Candidatus Aenigmatarchaeota archaeon]
MEGKKCDKRCVRAGIGVLFVKDGKVLLGKRHDDPVKADSELHGEGTWTVPGGKMDFQESPIKGARREAREETSLEAKGLELISVGNEVVPDAHFVTLGFLCREFEGEPRVMEPDEITEWRWFRPDELPERVFPPALKIIKNWLDGTVYKH